MRVVARLAMARRASRGLELVVIGIVETNRYRERPRRQLLGHVGDDEARIDAAREKGADRLYLRLQPIVDGSGEQVIELLEHCVIGFGRAASSGNVPVFSDGDVAVAYREPMRRRNL